MKIILETIPHKDHRYKNTVGDWFEQEDGTVVIRSSNFQKGNYEFLVLIHELVEWYLCRCKGITQEMVDEFDMSFEDKKVDFEIGDLPEAPYKKQHCFATGVERLLASELGVCWSDYEEELNGLS